jgi:ubiquinone/menaquinone biosynthesis C-methylase UbiE
MDGEARAEKPAGAPAARRPEATAVYALGRDREESARLRQQSEEMRPYSARLLDRTGLTRGQSAIDMGCGPSGIIDLLAERVTPGGRVAGLDADPVHVAMAREFAAKRGLGSVELMDADARHTGLPPDSFDVVHGRTLLVTIPDPAEVLAEMRRLARPGGWVVGLEADAEHSLCYPAHPAWDRLCEIFRTAFSRNGADPFIGRRMPELYRRAGVLAAYRPLRRPGDQHHGGRDLLGRGLPGRPHRRADKNRRRGPPMARRHAQPARPADPAPGPALHRPGRHRGHLDVLRRAHPPRLRGVTRAPGSPRHSSATADGPTRRRPGRCRTRTR